MATKKKAAPAVEAEAQEEKAAILKGSVAVPLLNIRRKPSMSGEVLRIAKSGEAVEYEQAGEWLKLTSEPGFVLAACVKPE